MNPLVPESGNLDKQAIFEAYQASPHLEWTRFCRDEKLPATARFRQEFPVRQWQEEKKRRIAQEFAEQIDEAVFRVKPEIKKDIVETLRRYPKFHDKIMAGLEYCANELQRQMNLHTERVRQDPKAPAMDPDIQNGWERLSYAAAAITRSKYASVMLSEASLQDIEFDAVRTVNLDEEKAQAEAAATASSLPCLVVKGFEEITDERIAHIFTTTFDRPFETAAAEEPLPEPEE